MEIFFGQNSAAAYEAARVIGFYVQSDFQRIINRLSEMAKNPIEAENERQIVQDAIRRIENKRKYFEPAD